jgi:hypothetical protein
MLPQRSDRKLRLKLNLAKQQRGESFERLGVRPSSRENLMISLSPRPKKQLKVSKLYQNLLKINLSGDRSARREPLRRDMTGRIEESRTDASRQLDKSGSFNSTDCTIFFEHNGKKHKVRVDIERGRLSFKEKVIYKVYELFRLKHPKDMEGLDRIVGVTANPANLQLDFFMTLRDFRMDCLAG